jgi:Lipocalin-like domain
MRCIVALLAIFFARAALAEEDMSARLFGSWRLISFQLKVVGEEAEPKDIFGPNPIGRIIFSPEHRVVVFISRAGRRPPTSESEAAALLSSMTAYTGKFRLDGDKFITQVDGAWNEFYKGSEQVRYFELTGDKLSIRTPEQQSGILIGKRTVATLMWEREAP